MKTVCIIALVAMLIGFAHFGVKSVKAHCPGGGTECLSPCQMKTTDHEKNPDGKICGCSTGIDVEKRKPTKDILGERRSGSEQPDVSFLSGKFDQDDLSGRAGGELTGISREIDTGAVSGRPGSIGNLFGRTGKGGSVGRETVTFSEAAAFIGTRSMLINPR